MSVATHILSADTQAILLLCGRFEQAGKTKAKPLTLTEYNALARQLQQDGMRPGDLLSDAGFDWLQRVLDDTAKSNRAIALLERGGILGLKVEEWTNRGLWILSRSDDDYPRRLKLKLKHQAPPILYGVGDRTLTNRGGLAVVGSRDVDAAGLAYCRQVSQTCVQHAINIVSGGARGVDQAAMVSAIELGGCAVGILASDLEKASVSKRYRQGLRNRQLALVSPFNPAARFQVGNAMARNKYIYALADQALVVSTSYAKGGTWAGATEEMKRDNRIRVWVRAEGEVPEGNLQLQKLGAIAFSPTAFTESIHAPVAEQPAPLSPLALKGRETQLSIPAETPAVTVDKEQSCNGQKDSNLSDNPQPLSPAIPADVFHAILPFVKRHLQEQPLKIRELAKRLEVKEGQAKDWMNKAIEMGIAEKTRKGYQLLTEKG